MKSEQSGKCLNLPITRKSLQQIRQRWYTSSQKQPFLFSYVLPVWEKIQKEETIENFCIDLIWTKNLRNVKK
jgi:hypothetical protein